MGGAVVAAPATGGADAASGGDPTARCVILGAYYAKTSATSSVQRQAEIKIITSLHQSWMGGAPSLSDSKLGGEKCSFNIMCTVVAREVTASLVLKTALVSW